MVLVAVVRRNSSVLWAVAFVAVIGIAISQRRLDCVVGGLGALCAGYAMWRLGWIDARAGRMAGLAGGVFGGAAIWVLAVLGAVELATIAVGATMSSDASVKLGAVKATALTGSLTFLRHSFTGNAALPLDSAMAISAVVVLTWGLAL